MLQPNKDEIILLVHVDNLDVLRNQLWATLSDFERDQMEHPVEIDALLSFYISQIMSGELDYESDDFFEEADKSDASTFDIVRILDIGLGMSDNRYYFVSANIIPNSTTMSFTLRKGPIP